MRPLPKTVRIHNNWWLRKGDDTPEHLKDDDSMWYNGGACCAGAHYLKACGFTTRLLLALEEIGDPTELAFDAENENDFRVTPRQHKGLAKLCIKPTVQEVLSKVTSQVSAPSADILHGLLKSNEVIDSSYTPNRVELYQVISAVNDTKLISTEHKQRILRALFMRFLDCEPLFIGF